MKKHVVEYTTLTQPDTCCFVSRVRQSTCSCLHFTSD